MFNTSVDSNELMAGTNYNILRSDRGAFVDSRSTGGGVIMCIKNGINFESVTVDLSTIEFICARLIIGAKHYIITNVYIPPYRTRTLALLIEVSQLIASMRKQFDTDEIIIAGDFNLPGIRWNFSDGNVGFLSPSTGLNNAESKFVDIITSHGVFQINPLTNTRGIYLDLVFVTDVSNTQIVLPQIEEQIDHNTRHHNAILVVVSYLPLVERDQFKRLNYATTNLRQTKVDISTHVFDLPGQNDIDEALFDMPITLDIKIGDITDNLRTIQDRNTSIRRHLFHGDSLN